MDGAQTRRGRQSGVSVAVVEEEVGGAEGRGGGALMSAVPAKKT